MAPRVLLRCVKVAEQTNPWTGDGEVNVRVRVLAADENGLDTRVLVDTLERDLKTYVEQALTRLGAEIEWSTPMSRI